jgi:hypothetical protein
MGSSSGVIPLVEPLRLRVPGGAAGQKDIGRA